MPEAETGGHSLISRDNQHLITGEQQQHQHQYQHQQQHQQDPAQITSDSPLWRLFLDSSCSSASVFLRVQLASAQSYFHSPTPWNPRGSGHVSRKVARLLDSFRPGSTSYCPFPGKNFEPDGNNNHRAAAPPTFPLLLRPSEVPVERQEFRSQPVDIPQATPPVSPASTPSSLASSPPLSVSREEETRRQLYLPLGRPRPFYSVQPPDQSTHQEGNDNLGEAEQRPPALFTARSLQDEVRAHLVQRLGLVRLEKLLRSGEKEFALPNVVRNTLLTLPCSDFTEDGCASSLRSSASYCVRCRLDNRQYLAVFATSEVDKSATNLWEEQRAWLLGLNTQLVQHVLALAVDPLTENIFYILDLDRGENLSSLLSRVDPSCSKVCLGDNVERSCTEAADIIDGGVTRALADLKSVGLTYPGLRQDRVWIREGQVVLENGLLVKGSPSTPVDQTSLTGGLRDPARANLGEDKCQREEGQTAVDSSSTN